VAPEPAGPDIFSRAIQANVGIGVGMIAFGAAMGALFAVAYAICLGRVGRLRPRSIALLVAAGGFVAIYLTPFVKYPANPPSIGHPETVKDRADLYLLMVFFSIVFLLGAVWLGQRLRTRFGNWNASLAAGAAFVVAIGIVMLIMPSFGHLAHNRAHYGNFASETPQPLKDAHGNIVFPGFPADTLYLFRFYSVAAQAILWTIIALVFAPMAERLLEPRPGKRAAHDLIAA
jgi:hypothetical protein